MGGRRLGTDGEEHSDPGGHGLQQGGGTSGPRKELWQPSGRSRPSASTWARHPPAFLREVPEFNFLRVLVLQQPNLLQPLLLSFGQSHPEVMEAINTHKEQFVAMLYEQTGGATNKYARHH